MLNSKNDLYNVKYDYANHLWWWLLRFYDSTRDEDDTTVGVGHSRRCCNTGYDQSQERRPSTLKCIGPISKGDIEPNHPSEINPNSDRSDGRSRRFVQYRVDQSQGQRPRSLQDPNHLCGHIFPFFSARCNNFGCSKAATMFFSKSPLANPGQF